MVGFSKSGHNTCDTYTICKTIHVKFIVHEFYLNIYLCVCYLRKVSSALAYLHTNKNIIHFDVKPKSILVFRYPQPGKSCFSMQASSAFDSWHGDDVLVKLADLGISAFLGPNGFQHKMTTSGYVAPEVLKYSGKENLTEKVS